MNPEDSPKELRARIVPSVGESPRSKFARLHGFTATVLLLLVCVDILGQTSSGKEEYVRLSAPNLLSFDDLVQLEKVDDPSPELAIRLDQLLHTPFLSNEAFYGGARPNRPSSDARTIHPRNNVEHRAGH